MYKTVLDNCHLGKKLKKTLQQGFIGKTIGKECHKVILKFRWFGDADGA
jgi:hypothetical protein